MGGVISSLNAVCIKYTLIFKFSAMHWCLPKCDLWTRLNIAGNCSGSVALGWGLVTWVSTSLAGDWDSHWSLRTTDLGHILQMARWEAGTEEVSQEGPAVVSLGPGLLWVLWNPSLSAALPDACSGTWQPLSLGGMIVAYEWLLPPGYFAFLRSTFLLPIKNETEGVKDGE